MTIIKIYDIIGREMKISHPIQRRIDMDIEGILNKLREVGSAYTELYANEISI